MGKHSHKWRNRAVAGLAGLTLAAGTGAVIAHDSPFQVPEGKPYLDPPTAKKATAFAQKVREGKASVIAHRGDSAHYPENTLAAFEAAIQGGADALELDLHVCKTGEAIVIHDDSVDRTTNGSGKVADMTLDEIKALDAGGGEQIPTLGEVLELVDGRAKLYIEPKTSIMPPKDWSNTFSNAVEKGNWNYNQLVLVGAGYTTFYNIRDRDPNIHVAPSFDSAAEPIVETAKYMGAKEVNIKYTEVPPELRERLQKEGIGLNVWTVDSEKDLLGVVNAGVDGIVTNEPELARRIVNVQASIAKEIQR